MRHKLAKEHRLVTVGLYNMASLLSIYAASLLFRRLLCDTDGCFQNPLSFHDYLAFTLKALVRPLFLTPVSWGSGARDDSVSGVVLYGALGAIGTVVPYLVGRYINAHTVDRWLTKNLPFGYNTVQNNVIKIVLALRVFAPFVAADVVSLTCGLLRLDLKKTLIFTFVGETINRAVLWIFLGSHVTEPRVAILFGVVGILVFEMDAFKQKKGIIIDLLTIFKEIKTELTSNNRLDDEAASALAAKTSETVVLAYGFFSSRRSLRALKIGLESAGYDVVVPKLPGLFDVLNTGGLLRTSEAIELECRRLESEKVTFHVVGFSKGALAAAYMFASHQSNLGARSFISIAAPYEGSAQTYALLFTPLGFFWRDVWDMRPGSQCLAVIRSKLKSIEKTTQLSALYSRSDKVAGTGARMAFVRCHETEMTLKHQDFMSSPETISLVLDRMKATIGPS